MTERSRWSPLTGETVREHFNRAMQYLTEDYIDAQKDLVERYAERAAQLGLDYIEDLLDETQAQTMTQLVQGDAQNPRPPIPATIPCPFCVGRLSRVVTTCEDCQGSGIIPAPPT